MTLPGPDIVYACPTCGTRVRQFSYMSMFITDVVEWTDGYVQLIGIERQNPYHLCDSCDTPFWLRRKYEVAGPADDTMASVVEPTAANHRRALAGGLARSRNEKMLIRQLILQADARALDHSAGMPDLPSEQHDNFVALSKLLRFPRSVEEQVLRGEVLRQMGDFTRSMRTVAPLAKLFEIRRNPDGSPRVYPDEPKWALYRRGAVVYALASQEDPLLAAFGQDGSFYHSTQWQAKPLEFLCPLCEEGLKAGLRFCPACGNQLRRSTGLR